MRRPEDPKEERFKKVPCECGHAFLTAAWVLDDYHHDWTVRASNEAGEILARRAKIRKEMGL